MKTVIYNIGRLAGVLPEGVMRLEGAQMNHVECIEDAYLVIEDGKIAGFGPQKEISPLTSSSRNDITSAGGRCGLQNRATPLAAGGGARDEVVGGVVLDTNITAVTRTKLGDDAVFIYQVGILDAFYVGHLFAFQHSLALRQDSSQCTYIIYNSLHAVLF